MRKCSRVKCIFVKDGICICDKVEYEAGKCQMYDTYENMMSTFSSNCFKTNGKYKSSILSLVK